MPTFWSFLMVDNLTPDVQRRLIREFVMNYLASEHPEIPQEAREVLAESLAQVEPPAMLRLVSERPGKTYVEDRCIKMLRGLIARYAAN